MTRKEYLETCAKASGFAWKEAITEASKGNVREAIFWLDTAVNDAMSAREEIESIVEKMQ